MMRIVLLLGVFLSIPGCNDEPTSPKDAELPNQPVRQYVPPASEPPT